MFATLYACLLLFWFFQSPTAETPAWILTLKTSNDAVLRKEVSSKVRPLSGHFRFVMTSSVALHPVWSSVAA